MTMTNIDDIVIINMFIHFKLILTVMIYLQRQVVMITMATGAVIGHQEQLSLFYDHFQIRNFYYYNVII